jgi:hypothetical protein
MKVVDQQERARRYAAAWTRLEKMRHQRDRALTRGRWTQEEVDRIQTEAKKLAAELAPYFE